MPEVIAFALLLTVQLQPDSGCEHELAAAELSDAGRACLDRLTSQLLDADPGFLELPAPDLQRWEASNSCIHCARRIEPEWPVADGTLIVWSDGELEIIARFRVDSFGRAGDLELEVVRQPAGLIDAEPFLRSVSIALGRSEFFDPAAFGQVREERFVFALFE